MHLVQEASHTLLLETDTVLVDILAEKNLLPPEEGFPMFGRNAPGQNAAARTSREQARLAARESEALLAASLSAQVTANEAVDATSAAAADPSNMAAFQARWASKHARTRWWGRTRERASRSGMQTNQRLDWLMQCGWGSGG